MKILVAFTEMRRIFAAMKLDRLFAGFVCCVALVLITTGCGGITASQSISPASFFLPGLLHNQPSTNKFAPYVGQPVDVTMQKVAKSL